MRPINSNRIRAIVFDLDGTLYVSNEFAASIKYEAAAYMSTVLGTEIAQASRMLADTRSRLAEENDAVPTLSAVCCTLGGTIPAMHAWFEARLRPESHLVRDNRVIELLERLGKHFELHIYTNNNRVLATRIIDYLGLRGMFTHIFTIDDTWCPKPDDKRMGQIIALGGYLPEQTLFVGDRYDVDLRLPEQAGCPVYLSQSVEQLLRLEKLIPIPFQAQTSPARH